MSRPYNIIIAGEGGQGALSMAKIMATVAWSSGRSAVYVPYFSTEKRGGLSMSYARIGDAPIPFPKFAKADLWVALSQRAVDRIFDYLDDHTAAIVNSSLVRDTSRIAKWNPRRVDATAIAKLQLKKPRTFNMVMLGAMLRSVPGLPFETFSKALEKTFADKYEKDPELKALNEQALAIGYELRENAAV